jgi:hypothetical protein
VARVNGEPIFLDDVMTTIFPGRTNVSARPDVSRQFDALMAKATDQLIDRELLYQDALKKLNGMHPGALKKLKQMQKDEFRQRLRELQARDHTTEEQFMANLRRYGMTLQQLEQIEERKFVADQYLRSRVWPFIQRETAYPELFAYYENHPSEFQRPDSVDWEDIFIAIGSKRNPSRDDGLRSAKKLAARLRRGEQMESLLRLDDGDSKSRGGEGMGHLKGQIDPPELEEHLFKMRAGQIRVVKIATGYHVIRLVHRIEAGQRQFNNETREMIAAKLRQMIGERERSRIIRELRSQAEIEIVNPSCRQANAN